jgi:hypothetical protein
VKIYLGTGLLVVATAAFILQLALPLSPPAVAMRAGVSWVVETLRSSTTVGAYRLFLRDAEAAQEISPREVEALLADQAAVERGGSWSARRRPLRALTPRHRSPKRR